MGWTYPPTRGSATDRMGVMKSLLPAVLTWLLLLSAVASDKPVRKFPHQFKHKPAGRCMVKGKWIRGCK